MMHNFIGKAQMKYNENITERYDLLKSVYQSKSPGMSYKNLNARMLIYVVDLPVPISEIKWAMKFEKGRSSSWSKKFNYVRYDMNRFNRGQFVWNKGQYNLLNIRKNGGICIDRAYYTVITARVWGIPSMLFTGKGRTGGHAWLGLMQHPGRWTMDLHRYSQGNYSAGNTRNPQTNELINDHELSLLVSPEFFTWGYYNAVKTHELAQVYLKRKDTEEAVSLMVDSIRKQPLYEPPWTGIYDYYIGEKKYKEAFSLLRKQAVAFSSHEDKLVVIYNRQIDVLEKLGKTKEADYIRKSVLIKMRKRDDLMAELTASQAEEFIAKGKKDEAKKVYEKFITINAREGFKIIESVESYVEMMDRTEQLPDAIRFLKGMVNRVPRDSRGWMEGFLLEAYEKNGDTKEAAKLKERMKGSRKDIDF